MVLLVRIISEELRRQPNKVLQAEAAALGSPAGNKGSAERSAWWRSWEQKIPELQEDEGADPDAMLMRMAN